MSFGPLPTNVLAGVDNFDRELDLCNALKLSSKEHQSVTAYQISFKGQKLLEFLSIEDRQDVDSFIFAPSMESVSIHQQSNMLSQLHRQEATWERPPVIAMTY